MGRIKEVACLVGALGILERISVAASPATAMSQFHVPVGCIFLGFFFWRMVGARDLRGCSCGEGKQNRGD